MYVYIYIPPGGFPLVSLKLIILIVLGAFWVYQALGDMITIVVSNSHFGKRSAARVMTALSSHVDAQSVNSY